MPLNIIDYSRFLGINNTDDPMRMVAKKGAYLTRGMNVDIDDKLLLSRRDGFTRRVVGANIHSLWSHEDVCLYCDGGGSLLRLNPGYASTTLLSGLEPNARFCYAPFNDRVYFSNDIFIAHVKQEGNTVYYPPTPTDRYKVAVKPGHIMEYFNARLYVAWNSVLWMTDPLNPDMIDMRNGFKVFRGRITMVKAVKDGLYVSAGDATYFVEGSDPSEAKLTKVLGSGAYEGSAITVESWEFPKGLIADAAVWTTSEGVFIGGPGGYVVNKTDIAYTIPDGISWGAALEFDKTRMDQYIFTYPLEQSFSGSMALPRLRLHMILEVFPGGEGPGGENDAFLLSDGDSGLFLSDGASYLLLSE
jgi:hypothetical protein